MGTRGLEIVRYRGRYYVYYHQYDSYPSGWPKDLVRNIPRKREEYEKWLTDERARYKKYRQALEAYLTISREEPEAGTDSVGHQLSCWAPHPASTTAEWRTDCPKTETLPSYTVPFNDLYIEGIYTIDLDREVFTVNNTVHFKLDRVSHFEWFNAIAHGGHTLEYAKVPRSALSSIHYAVTPSNITSKAATPKIVTTKVTPKGLSGFAPSERHGVLLCGGLFARYRDKESTMLEHLLRSWGPTDFPFREYAWLVLCFASLNRNLSLEPATQLHRRNRDGYTDLFDHTSKVYQIPELASDSAVGAHLEGYKAGEWPEEDTYWFENAVMRLVAGFDNGQKSVSEQVVEVQQYCMAIAPGKTINAALLSVADVVLVKIFANGNIEHTDTLPLFDLQNDYTVNSPPKDSSEGEDLPDSEDEEVNEEKQSSGRDEVKMMGLMNRLLFDPDANFSEIQAGFAELRKDPDADPSENKEAGTDTKSAGDNDPTDNEKRDEMNTKNGIDLDEGAIVGKDESSSMTSAKESADENAQSIEGTSDPSTDENTTSDAARPSPPPEQEPSHSTEENKMASSCMIPTEDGYITKRYNAAGVMISCKRYIEKVRNGQTITTEVPLDYGEEKYNLEPDKGFYALAHFLDAIARQKLAPFRHPTSGKGALPLEALRMIVDHIDDVATYRACMSASILLRSICMQNFRIDDATIFLANDETKSTDIDKLIEKAATGEMTFNGFERSDRDPGRYRPSAPKYSMFGMETEKGVLYYAVAGQERDRRILCKESATVFHG